MTGVRPAAGSGALQGRVIVVTRPRQQAGELADAIAAQGGLPLLFPLLEIGPAPDPAPLEQVAARLGEFRLAVFVSPNAVQYALPTLLASRPWPPTLQAVAVGPGTVRALAAAGIASSLCPATRFDSEALLELPELAPAQVAGQGVLILRGNGGRELLGDTLAARGARVERLACDSRSGPGAGSGEFLARLEAGSLDALILSSSEALAHLLALVPAAGPRQRLLDLPLFVPHARIAAGASAAGFTRVVLTEAADAGLLAGLCAYNWPQS